MNDRIIQSYQDLYHECVEKRALNIALECALLLYYNDQGSALLEDILGEVKKKKQAVPLADQQELEQLRDKKNKLDQKSRSIPLLSLDSDFNFVNHQAALDPDCKSVQKLEALLNSKRKDESLKYELSEVASELYRAGDFINAQRGFAKVLQIAPKAFEAHFNYVLSLVRLGKYHEAIAEIDELLKNRKLPSRHEIVYVKGVAESYLGNKADAYLYYSKALEIQPDYVKAKEEMERIKAQINAAPSSQQSSWGSAKRDSEIDEMRDFSTFVISPEGLPRLEDFGGYAVHVAAARRLITGLSIQTQDNGVRVFPIKSWIIEGVPGTGKTYFGKCLAGSLQYPLLVVPVDRVMDPYYGVSERNLANLFAYAFSHQPICLLLDELELFCPARYRSATTRIDNKFTAMFLSQFTKYFNPESESKDLVVFIGTTNFLKNVDPAMLRPGRFHTFHLDYPDVYDLAQILKIHIKRMQTQLPDAEGEGQLFQEIVTDATDFFIESFVPGAHGSEENQVPAHHQDPALMRLMKILEQMREYRFTADYVREVVTRIADDAALYQHKHFRLPPPVGFDELKNYIEKAKLSAQTIEGEEPSADDCPGLV